MLLSETSSNSKLNHKPQSPPPADAPQYSPAYDCISADTIRQHLYDVIYAWMIYGNSFWMYPVDSMGDILFCYAWDGSDWRYIRLKTSLIDSLCC